MEQPKSIANFIEWTKIKIQLHFTVKEKELYFKEREIWWASLGVNIGFEQDGKNERFERPILVLKKFNKNVLWILPLTSRSRDGKYYYELEYNGRKFQVILSQLRLISSRRLTRKIRRLSAGEFNEIRTRLKGFL